MDKQRLQPIESLQITDHSVKCQKCGISVRIVEKLTKLKSNRITILERRIRWLENYRHRRGGDNNSNNKNDNDLKALKQELADLLEEEAKADKLRSLPLYSCRITGWKFVCSKCYGKVYWLNEIKIKDANQRPKLYWLTAIARGTLPTDIVVITLFDVPSITNTRSTVPVTPSSEVT